MQSDTDRTFVTVTRTQGNNIALKDGSIRPAGFAFDFHEVDPLIAAFRRMVRGLEFDICEMSITTYVTARRFGVKFTALPVFIVRGFHHGAILVNAKSGITRPKDLEGRRVGVNRGYTVTTGVWARGILAAQYGVDLDSITWLLSGDEHVAAFRPPANVVPIGEGKTLAQMLIDGEIAAAVNIESDHPDITPLIANPFEAGLDALRTRGDYPINHLIAVKDDVLNANPGLAPEIFDAFAQAKRRYVERLRSDAIASPTAIDTLHRRVMDVTGDPLPYGVEPNRRALETLIAHAVGQHILPEPVAVESLFAPDTLGRSA